MSPTILIIGKSGQVGAALHQCFTERDGVYALDRSACDLADVDQLRSVIRQIQPDIIINAAAYTAVDRAETDEDACYRINAIAPGVIAEEANQIGAWLIHYSTDYVFDGDKAAAYLEDDEPRPLNVYGRTKLAGDMAILAAGGSHTILRVSWVYGLTGQNFAKTILRLAAERDELRIVADQIGAPTSAELIADVTSRIVNLYAERNKLGTDSGELSGIFNLAPASHVSWHGYAVELIKESVRQGHRLRTAADRIIPIPSQDYAAVAPRPKNSLLDTRKIRRLLSIDFPDWQEDVRRFVARQGRLKP